MSPPAIVGAHLLERELAPLWALAKSSSLWERIAIISTQHFIRRGDFADTLRIARTLLDDHHDLIHKGCGWMLREVGKRDQSILERLHRRHTRRMPRTMLRYAIERFPEEVRRVIGGVRRTASRLQRRRHRRIKT